MSRINGYSEQIRGVSYKPEDVVDTLDDTSIVLLRANNIRDGQINFDDVVYIKKNKVSDKQMLRKGDILICASSGSKDLVGKAAQVKDDINCTFGAFCKVIRPKEIHNGFLGMYFQSNKYRRTISRASAGANINNIKNEDIDSLELDVPSADKQEEIYEVLSKLDNVIYTRKKELLELDNLIKSRFVEMFGDPVSNQMGWNVVSCKEMASKIGSGATPKGGRESYGTEGISLIRSMNVYNNRFEYKDLAYITDEQAEKLDNVTIEENDVLLNITGASVARCCVVPKDLLPARVNQHVSIIRCKPEILSVFISYMFTDTNYQKLLWSIATSGGATREAITKQQIEELQLIVPPIELQERFAEFVTQVDKLKFEVQKSIDETQRLMDSLMQQYFG